MTRHNSTIKVHCKCSPDCDKVPTIGYRGYNFGCVPDELKQQLTKNAISKRNRANVAALARKLYKVQPRQKKGLKRQIKPIAKLSKTMVANLKVYVPAKREYLKAHPMCEANLGNCTRISVDIHHKAGRIGKLLYATAYFLSVCRNCHNELENKPLIAKELGFSVSRLF